MTMAMVDFVTMLALLVIVLGVYFCPLFGLLFWAAVADNLEHSEKERREQAEKIVARSIENNS